MDATDKLINMTFSDENINKDMQDQLNAMHTLLYTKFAYDDNLLQYVLRNYSNFNKSVIINIISAYSKQLEYKDKNGLTPLMLATQYCHDDLGLEIIKELLKAGADINATHIKNDGITILMMHILTDEYYTYNIHLSNLSNNMSRNKIKKPRLDTIKLLISESEGIDINATSRCGHTALTLTIARIPDDKIYLDIYRELMTAGANVNDTHSRALQAAYKLPSTYLYIVKELIAKIHYINVYPELHIAISNTPDESQLGVVKELIKAGVDVNKSYKDGDTPLITAIRSSNNVSKLDVVKELIKAGADVNKVGVRSHSPLCIAARSQQYQSQLELVKELIKAGADVNYNNSNGQISVLMNTTMDLTGSISKSISTDIFKELLIAGADVNLKDRNSNTILTRLCRHGSGYEDIDLNKHMFNYVSIDQLKIQIDRPQTIDELKALIDIYKSSKSLKSLKSPESPESPEFINIRQPQQSPKSQSLWKRLFSSLTQPRKPDKSA